MKSLLFRVNHLPIWKVPVSLWGSQFVAPSADRLLSLLLHKLGVMGKTEKAFFESVISEGMTVIDVGANQGIFSLLFAKLVGKSGQVISIEPEPLLYKAFAENVQRNQIENLAAHNLAAGVEEGRLFLNRQALNSGDNRMNRQSENTTEHCVEVRVSRLDDLLKGMAVDFLKMDIQGWEFDAIEGIENLLKSQPKIKILFEYWPMGLSEAGRQPVELLEWFDVRAYKLEVLGQGKHLGKEDFQMLTDSISGWDYVDILAYKESAGAR